MYCPNCGTQMPDSSKFCQACGFRLDTSEPGSPGMDRSMASIMVNKKSEALALILSLIIPGLGQIYVGKAGKGAALIVAAIILGVLTFLLLFPGILYIVIWIYGMYDAYTTAKEYNSYLLNHNGQPPW